MREMFAKTALHGQGAVSHLGTTLAVGDLGAITSIAAFPGQEKPLSRALKPLGMAMPKVGQYHVKGDAMLVWTGRDQAFLIGCPCPDLGTAAAVTDQSGGWAAFTLSGPAAADALMRYVPMDLRVAAFPVGTVLRTPLYHMSMILLRTGDQAFTILVFRSMARTAWHEIEVALTSLGARAALEVAR